MHFRTTNSDTYHVPAHANGDHVSTDGYSDHLPADSYAVCLPFCYTAASDRHSQCDRRPDHWYAYSAPGGAGLYALPDAHSDSHADGYAAFPNGLATGSADHR